jgi:hypothetical protein
MKKLSDGTYVRAVRYIARKEDFQRAVTCDMFLPVLVVYPDASVEHTKLSNFIVSVRKGDGIDSFHITTSETKFGTIEVVLI